MIEVSFFTPYGLSQSYPLSTKARPEAIPTRTWSLVGPDGTPVTIPNVSANALRARLRRAAGRAILEALRDQSPDAKLDKLNWQLVALMLSGGTSMTDYKAPPETIDLLQNEWLPIYLFGGQFFINQMPGHLRVMPALMVTAASQPAYFGLRRVQQHLEDIQAECLALPAGDGRSLIQIVRSVKQNDDVLRLDDSGQAVDPTLVVDPNTRAALAKQKQKDKAAPAESADIRQNNIFAYEVAIGSSYWASGFSLEPNPANLQMDRYARSLLRYAAEEAFPDQTTLGGHAAHGIGLADTLLFVPDDWPDRLAWREWITAYNDQHPELSLQKALEPNSPLVQTVEKTNAAKKKDAARNKAAAAATTSADSPDSASPEGEEHDDDHSA